MIVNKQNLASQGMWAGIKGIQGCVFVAKDRKITGAHMQLLPKKLQESVPIHSQCGFLN